MNIIFLFLFFCLSASAQTGSYYHDPALDTIANNLVVLDSDFNSKTNSSSSVSSDGLTQSNLLANAILGETNVWQLYGTITNGVSANNVLLFNAVSNTYGPYSSGFASGGPVYPTSSGPGVVDLALGSFLGHSYYLNLNVTTGGYIPMWMGTLVSHCLLVITYIVLFLKSIHFLQSDTFKAMSQRQVQGSNESLFGFNASSLTGIGFAAIILASLGALSTALLLNGFLSVCWSFMTSFNSDFSAISTLPGWDVLTFYIPIQSVLSAYMGYWVFRYFVAFPAFLVVRGCILWLIV